jgi:hypothetical protein
MSEGARLHVTDEQYEQAQGEMERSLAERAAQPSQPAAGVAEQLPDDGSQERLDDVAERVGEIVSHISASAVYGKLNDGTAFQTGDRPPVVIHHEPSQDYSMYPRDSVLYNAEFNCIYGIGGSYNDANLARHYHYMMMIPGSKNSVVDYFFEGDTVDHESRRGGFVHVMAVMPSDDAETLKNMVVSAPDVAEEYFQQVAAGLENPGPGPGIGRARSKSVVMLGDWDRNNPPLNSSGRKTANFGSVFGRDVVTVGRYSDGGEYGSVVTAP